MTMRASTLVEPDDEDAEIYAELQTAARLAEHLTAIDRRERIVSLHFTATEALAMAEVLDCALPVCTANQAPRIEMLARALREAMTCCRIVDE